MSSDEYGKHVTFFVTCSDYHNLLALHSISGTIKVRAAFLSNTVNYYISVSNEGRGKLHLSCIWFGTWFKYDGPCFGQ